MPSPTIAHTRATAVTKVSPEKKLPDLSTTTAVRIIGHPFVWLVERIVERAPHLREIHVGNSYLPRLSAHARNMLQARDVRLVTINASPQRIDLRAQKKAKDRRTFLQFLPQQARERFDELVRLGLHNADIVMHVYGSTRTDRSFIEMLPDHFTIRSRKRLTTIADGTLAYLGCPIEHSVPARLYARRLAKRVERLRTKQPSRNDIDMSC